MTIGGYIALIILGAIYFAPSLVAIGREHRNTAGIFVVNLALGWTFVGWIVALVWALTHAPAVVAIARTSAPVGDRRRPCPLCAEAILPAARVCHYCKQELPLGWADR